MLLHDLYNLVSPVEYVVSVCGNNSQTPTNLKYGQVLTKMT